MEPSLIVQNKFTSTSDLLRQLAKSHYNEPGQSDPNLGKTQNTMDQIHRSPTRWETKRKGREGAPRTPSPAMASSPKLQRTGTATTPGKKQRTRSGEPTGSYPGCSPPPSPGARLVRSLVVVGDTGGPPSICSTTPPPTPALMNTKGATREIWSLTTPLGKRTSGRACLISPYGTPVPQRQHATRGRSTIASARLRKIPHHSQAFF